MNRKFIIQYVVTPFCGVCKTAKPMIEILAEALEMELTTIDANKNKALLQLLKIRQVPAVIVIDIERDEPIFTTDELTDISNLFATISKAISH